MIAVRIWLAFVQAFAKKMIILISKSAQRIEFSHRPVAMISGPASSSTMNLSLDEMVSHFSGRARVYNLTSCNFLSGKLATLSLI